MDISELKNIAESYGLEILNRPTSGIIEVFFEDYPGFWDFKNYIKSNKLIDFQNSYITVYTKLRKTKSGKFVIINQRSYNINDYTTRRLHNLIKRIQKQIKVELIAKRLEGIKQDF